MLSSLRTQKVEPFRLSDERLILMQDDMHPSSFGVDEHEKTVLVDFGAIAMLPESFAAYTLSSNNLTAIASFGGLSKSPNVASMAAISSCLWTVSDAKLSASTCI